MFPFNRCNAMTVVGEVELEVSADRSERNLALIEAGLQEVFRRVPEPKRREYLLRIASVVARGGNAAELARDLALNPRVLVRLSHRLRMPSARRTMAWMRVLLAAKLLEDPDATFISIASACGYASDAALRRVLQEFLGLTPTELRARGPSREVLDRFAAELEALGT